MARIDLNISIALADKLLRECSGVDALYCIAALEVLLNCHLGFAADVGTPKSRLSVILPRTTKFTSPNEFDQFLCGDSVKPVVLRATRVQHATCTTAAKHLLAAIGVAAPVLPKSAGTRVENDVHSGFRADVPVRAYVLA